MQHTQLQDALEAAGVLGAAVLGDVVAGGVGVVAGDVGVLA